MSLDVQGLRLRSNPFDYALLRTNYTASVKGYLLELMRMPQPKETESQHPVNVIQNMFPWILKGFYQGSIVGLYIRAEIIMGVFWVLGLGMFRVLLPHTQTPRRALRRASADQVYCLGGNGCHESIIASPESIPSSTCISTCTDTARPHFRT